MYVTDLNEFIKKEKYLISYAGVKMSTKRGNQCTTFKCKRIGTLALMCPECYHITQHEVNANSVVCIHGNNNPEHKHVSANTQYTIDECSCCMNRNFTAIELDPNIAEAISIFNKKGYYTKYCCEGHGKNKSEPYIYFEDKDVMIQYMHTLPLSWYVNYDALQYKDKFIIRADPWNHHEALFEILDWAKMLKSRHWTYIGDK